MNIENSDKTEFSVKTKEFNWAERFPIIATGLNAIGFVVILLDAIQNWWINADSMSPIMLFTKMAGIVFMVLGTTIFCLSLDKMHNLAKIRRFLSINIWFYAIIISLVIYYLDLPSMWLVIGYALTVLLTEVILVLKRCRTNS